MSRLRCVPTESCRVWVSAQVVFLAFFLCVASSPAQNRVDRRRPGGRRRARLRIGSRPPQHLFLGTTNSWLYESLDEGATWHRLAKLGSGDGFVLDHIVVDSADPSTMYVGAWKDSDGGGLWISRDAGHTWRNRQISRASQCTRSCRRPPIRTCSLRERSRESSGQTTAAPHGPRSARPAATRFTKSSRWPSIPAIRTSFTRARGTCPGKPPTAARPGTTSSRASSRTPTFSPSSSIPSTRTSFT